ncbi:hypothetical protein LX32DRAFT_38968 [Colletotrichum zoysiae]|uniref:Uncharacterized protein n=1 Tax=Colletotrichum zoysiae TaxID=1216348 RepID=A0AAD9HBF5_9PEZI|nr:hypothetical protein LX32DRAFT_38968 [Colletotrichum zoysiae]
MLDTLPLLIASSTSPPTPRRAACTNRVTKWTRPLATSRFNRNYTLGHTRGPITSVFWPFGYVKFSLTKHSGSQDPIQCLCQNMVEVVRDFWSRTEKQDPRPATDRMERRNPVLPTNEHHLQVSILMIPSKKSTPLAKEFHLDESGHKDTDSRLAGARTCILATCSFCFYNH